MTTLTWPATLSCQPEQGSWEEEPQNDVVRFQPEAGPPIMRRRSTADSMLCSAVFVMTAAQYAIFRAFYSDDLAGGSLRFTMDHPITGTSYDWTFEGGPKMSATTNRKVRVSVQLRMLP